MNFFLRQGENTICPIDREAIDMQKLCLESISPFLVQSEPLPRACFIINLFGNLK